MYDLPTFLVSNAFHVLLIYLAICISWNWGSVFSVAMCYELDGLAFEVYCSPNLPRPALGPPSLLYNGYWGSSLWVK